MQKKDDKEGNKTADKQEKQTKNRAREKDWHRFAKKDQILAFGHAWKTNKLFNYARLLEKYAFFLAKLIFSHFYAN